MFKIYIKKLLCCNKATDAQSRLVIAEVELLKDMIRLSKQKNG